MLNKQSILYIKDNSKVLKVKIINLYLKKNIKFKDTFLGVVRLSRNALINAGEILNFLTVTTKKERSFITGRLKKSDHNNCILIKNVKTLEPLGSRFIGFFFSEVKNIKNQKIKNLINKCI